MAVFLSYGSRFVRTSNPTFLFLFLRWCFRTLLRMKTKMTLVLLSRGRKNASRQRGAHDHIRFSFCAGRGQGELWERAKYKTMSCVCPSLGCVHCDGATACFCLWGASVNERKSLPLSTSNDASSCSIRFGKPRGCSTTVRFVDFVGESW